MKKQIVGVILSVIVGLAELVIIHEIWLSGTWLTSDDYLGSILSGAKTAAFILLFIGGLIAETQNISDKTRRLLTVAVIVLGVYQLSVNVAVNFFYANIPIKAQSIFAGALTDYQIKLLWAGFDAMTRFLVVVIMWIVTGQVWRGIATATDAATDTQNNLQSEIDTLQASLTSLQADNEKLRAVAIVDEAWEMLPKAQKARAIVSVLAELNGDGPEVEAAARRAYGTAAVSRAMKE